MLSPFANVIQPYILESKNIRNIDDMQLGRILELILLFKSTDWLPTCLFLVYVASVILDISRQLNIGTAWFIW